MGSAGTIVSLSPRDFDAVLFDLDGVLTRTAAVHAAAWKKLFDEFLAERARQTGEQLAPFDEQDYRTYVDGKPRHDGVRSFLQSRGIDLPAGDPDDESGATVHGLGRRKDGYFMAQLAEQGVSTYEPAVGLVRSLRGLNIRTAVVSSSSNCAAVLEAAGISDLFDTRVDGLDLARHGLAGKPAPDAFLEAARRLSVEPARTMVIEDAIAGVAAARAGGFALVVGVDNLGQSQALREAGADVVVTSLAEVQIASGAPSGWTLVYDSYDAPRERMREALCAAGNGYFTTRGSMPWARADGAHYPGTYLAGGYNRLRTDIAGRVVENEDLVNLPNWLELALRFDGEGWFDEREVALVSYRQEYDLRRALLLRCLIFEHGDGRRTRLEEQRFVSMADMHLAALEVRLTPENWSGRVDVRSGIDGRVVNGGARLYKRFNNRHLVPLGGETVGKDAVLLHVRTSQSNLHVAQAARTRAALDGASLALERRLVEEQGYVGQAFAVDLAEGRTLSIEKVLCLTTSRDHATSEATVGAVKGIERAAGFETLMTDHVLAWRHLWRRYDVHLRPVGSGFNLNAPMLLRLNLLHLLQAASPNAIGLDVGVPARGWTGEAYQGHIFWDELFIFPTLNFRTPEITRSLLMYRFRRLDEARAAARQAGFDGAMFPWQSGSDGQEETQELNLNPHSGRWVSDNTWLQRHVGSAVAWNVWQYYQATCDEEFLQFYGAEMILEIARFWSSAAVFNASRDHYEIHGVMGPDEFHDGYPDAPAPGLRNNAYTNLMAVWVLLRALEVLERLPAVRRLEVESLLGLTRRDIERWEEISRRMFVPFHGNGIISQFEGWEHLRELDWDAYRARYGNIQRLELILEAEGDSANRYKVSKQPDVLMLFYLFSSDELRDIFARLGYPFEYETIPRNVDYYDRRSSHGSTLSRVVHAWVLARSDRPRAMAYFAEALQSDVNDIQQGTTAEGIHLGAMAGSIDLIQRVSTGLEMAGNALHINPRLPGELERLDLRIHYRGHWLDLRLTGRALTIRGWSGGAAPVRMVVNGQPFEFEAGSIRTFPLASPESRDSGRS
jgi:beta-phosphoglucomutase family hydrolase